MITETPAEIHRGHSGFVGIELSPLGLRQLSKLRAYIYMYTHLHLDDFLFDDSHLVVAEGQERVSPLSPRKKKSLFLLVGC